MDSQKCQHMLVDEDTLNVEVKEASLSKKDRVIEIGAGIGNLTGKIAERVGNVLAFEIDEKFRAQLISLEKKRNVNIVFGNAMEHSWEGYNKIVANIPYSLSEQIIPKAVKSGISELILVIGESFKEIIERNESKAGLIANLFFDAEFVMRIGREKFFPVPRVDSWLIHLKRRELSKKDKILAGILMKEGKLKNAVLRTFAEVGKTKNEAREILRLMGFNANVLEKPAKMVTGRFILRFKRILGGMNLD